MANVINKTTFQYIASVNTPDFDSSDWLINPDLSAVVGVPKKYWKVENDSVVEMDDSEKAQVNAPPSGQTYIPLNEVSHWIFTNNGNTKNRWLKASTLGASNEAPTIFMSTALVTGLSFSNTKDSADTDIEIYKGKSKIHTWQIRDSRIAYKAEGLSLPFASMDLLSVFCRDVGNKPKDVVVTVFYRYITATPSDGSMGSIPVIEED